MENIIIMAAVLPQVQSHLVVRVAHHPAALVHRHHQNLQNQKKLSLNTHNHL